MIRIMTESDRGAVTEMMRIFYASPAVETNGSDEIFKSDIDECVGASPFAEGYVFTEDDTVCGYAMLAKSFSTEYGRQCIWIEDIYVKPEYRSRGLGGRFFDYIKERYTDCVFRLEAEGENETAVRLYRKNGFTNVPYLEMWRK